jgi:hypothetical protein
MHKHPERNSSCAPIFLLTGPYEENFDILGAESAASTEATVMAPTAVATSARNGPSAPELPAALTTMTPFAIVFFMTGPYMLCGQDSKTP